jgi:hypothetical protein
MGPAIKINVAYMERGLGVFCNLLVPAVKAAKWPYRLQHSLFGLRVGLL